MRKRLYVLIPILILVFAAGLRVVEPALLVQGRAMAFDAFQRLHPRTYTPSGVRIVDLDDETLDRLGQWPWPRTQVARLVARLQELGAAVVAFDIVFAEPDRTSPRQVLPLWGTGPEGAVLQRMAASLPDHDAALAAEIAKAPTVAGFILTDQKNGKQPILKTGWAYGGDDPLRFIPAFPGAVVNLPALTAAAAGNASLNFFPDPDGVVRKVGLLFRQGDTLYPSLVAEVLRVAQGASSIVVKSSGGSGEASFGESTGIVRVKIGAAEIPTDPNGQLWLHDTGTVRDRYVPAWSIFDEGFDRSRIEGHIVLVGASAAGLQDRRSTPLNPLLPGVEVHAQLLEQISENDFLQRPDWTAGAELLYIIALGAALIVLVELLGALWVAAIGFVFIVGAVGLSWLAYVKFNWLLDPAFPTLSVLLVYLAASTLHFLNSERERRWVRGAFSRYLSPQLVERLADAPDSLTLGGELRQMTVMFCDVRGFTTISEQFDPQGLTRLINGFLTPMTEIILARKGTIDKYIGDCIMAFWNAPLDDPDHGRNACRAALAMTERLGPLNDALAAEAVLQGRRHIPLAVGMGLSSGEACVGNMGSEQRFDYSVLGDTVNLASRLEGQSKTYGVTIVISEETRRLAADFAALELDLIRVKGKTQPVRIFTLLGDETIAATPAFAELAEAHAGMLKAYRAEQWAEAEEALERCRRLDDGTLDGLYDLYAGRIAAFRAVPPPTGWDGVFTATSK